MPTNSAQNNCLKVFSTLSLRCVNVFSIKILSRIFQALGTHTKKKSDQRNTLDIPLFVLGLLAENHLTQGAV
jgi:hypothetical protein